MQKLQHRASLLQGHETLLQMEGKVSYRDGPSLGRPEDLWHEREGSLFCPREVLLFLGKYSGHSQIFTLFSFLAERLWKLQLESQTPSCKHGQMFCDVGTTQRLGNGQNHAELHQYRKLEKSSTHPKKLPKAQELPTGTGDWL